MTVHLNHVADDVAGGEEVLEHTPAGPVAQPHPAVAKPRPAVPHRGG